MYRLHGNSGASLQDRLIDASATELSSTRWQADHAGAAETRTARGAASSSAASMPGAAHTTAPASLISIGADADPRCRRRRRFRFRHNRHIGTNAGAHLAADATCRRT